MARNMPEVVTPKISIKASVQCYRMVNEIWSFVLKDVHVQFPDEVDTIDVPSTLMTATKNYVIEPKKGKRKRVSLDSQD